MSDEKDLELKEKKLNSNMENIEELPIPEAEMPEPKSSDISNLDEDFIPAPEDDKDEYLPEITEAQVKEEMMGLTEDGYTRSVVKIELKKIEKFNSETGTGVNFPPEVEMDENGYIEDDGTVPVVEFEVEYCKVKEYTLDGQFINLELTFDTPLDAELKALHQTLDEYRDMCTIFEASEQGTADFPLFTIYFMPVAYPGQAIAVYSQPLMYFKTMGVDDIQERTMHMLFSVDEVDVNLYKVKQEDIDEIAEYMNDRISAGLDV